jgi:hypothetical protein
VWGRETRAERGAERAQTRAEQGAVLVHSSNSLVLECSLKSLGFFRLDPALCVTASRYFHFAPAAGWFDVNSLVAVLIGQAEIAFP